MKCITPRRSQVRSASCVVKNMGCGRASSRSCLNNDVAAGFKLEGRLYELIVKLLKDNKERLEISVLESGISSLDRSTHKASPA